MVPAATTLLLRELLELLSPALSLLLRLLDGLDNLLLEGAPALLGPPLLLLDALVGLLLEATPASLDLLCELLTPTLAGLLLEALQSFAWLWTSPFLLLLVQVPLNVRSQAA